MKKNLLVYLMLCLFFPVVTKAEKKPFGKGLYWELKNGVLTISGNGDMPSYGPKDKTPWRKGETVHTIIIDEGITYIGVNAFCNNIHNHLPNVRELFLPSSLIEIGIYGFANLRNLKKIHFKEGLKYIGGYAFDNNNIDGLVIPKSVKEISYGAFAWCKNLKTIDIPNTIANIEKDVFIRENNRLFDGTIVSLPGNINLSNCENIGLSKQSVQQYLNGVRDIYGKSVIPATKGRIITKCIDKEDFSYYYRVSENGIEGIADKNGSWTVPLERGLVSLDSIKLKDVSYYIAKNSKTSKFCIISAKGKNILDKEYDLIERAGKGYLRIKDGNNYGIVTTRGKEIIPTTRGYSYINDYDGSYFAFTRKGYTGKCSRSGQETSLTKLPPTVDDIKVAGSYASSVEMMDGSTKYWRVTKGGRYGLTDAEGKVIVPTEMEALESAGTGYLRYKLNGFWGLMNYQGKILIDTDRGYTSIGDYKSFNKRFAYTMAGYKGECDAMGRPVSKIKVDTPKQNTSVASSSSSSSSGSSSSTFSSSGNSSSGNKTTTVVVEHHRDPIPVQEWQQCTNCWGEGKVMCLGACGGTGTYYVGDRLHICISCNGTGKKICPYCSGQGGKYVTVYR